MAYNGARNESQVGNVKTARFILVVPPEFINRRLIVTSAVRCTQRVAMVQIYGQRALLRRSEANWLPSVPE
eukprot:1045481-Pleurochrysis_carterae.AAC.1